MVLFCRPVFQLVGPQYVLLPGVIPPQVQDFAFPLEIPSSDSFLLNSPAC